MLLSLDWPENHINRIHIPSYPIRPGPSPAPGRSFVAPRFDRARELDQNGTKSVGVAELKRAFQLGRTLLKRISLS